MRVVLGYRFLQPNCRLGAALNGTLSSGVSGNISFGISGGLHPELVAGDWVVASAVRYGDRVFATDLKWAQELAKRLPGAILAEVAGSDVLLPTPVAKAYLYKTMCAAAVDMESHIFNTRDVLPRCKPDDLMRRTPQATSARHVLPNVRYWHKADIRGPRARSYRTLLRLLRCPRPGPLGGGDETA